MNSLLSIIGAENKEMGLVELNALMEQLNARRREILVNSSREARLADINYKEESILENKKLALRDKEWVKTDKEKELLRLLKGYFKAWNMYERGLFEKKIKELESKSDLTEEETRQLSELRKLEIDIGYSKTKFKAHTIDHIYDAVIAKDTYVIAEVEKMVYSVKDKLSGLFNRALFDIELEAIHKDAINREKEYTLIALDGDKFKSVNDTYGHDIGDRVLCYISNQLSAHARGIDFVARYGGEEFVMLLPGMGEENTNIRVKQLLESVADLDNLRSSFIEGDGFHAGLGEEKYNQMIAEGKLPKQITISVGAVTFHGEEKSNKDITPSRIHKLADEASYFSKNAGRNRGTVYTVNGEVKEEILPE